MSRGRRATSARVSVGLAAGLAVGLAVGLAGCGTGPGGSPEASSAEASAAAAGSAHTRPSAGPAARPDAITVFAAASLRTVLEDIGAAFTAQTGTAVRFSYAGSQDLVAQILEGAPADVLATANLATMQQLADEAPELLRAPAQSFATNTLTIVTPPDNPAGVGAWPDLARDGLRLVVCAPEVPCGAATEQVEASTGATLRPVSEESSVTDVLAKVVAGEADAGLVYATDARGADVATHPCPPCAAAVNTYPAAALAGGHADAALRFVDFLTSAPAQKALAEAGFGAP